MKRDHLIGAGMLLVLILGFLLCIAEDGLLESTINPLIAVIMVVWALTATVFFT